MKIIKPISTIIVSILFTIPIYSQKVRIIGDKDVIQVPPSEEQVGIEYSYYVIDNIKYKEDWSYSFKKNYDFSNEWIIYKNNMKSRKIAYSKVNGDTCVIIQLWRDSLIKSKEIYIKGVLTKYEWYCKNGQLISKGDFSTDQNDTIYYCNGKYKMLYDNFTGETIYYYESGKVMSKGIRDKNNYLRSEGLWVDYDEKGNAIWFSYYQYGEEIYSGKEYPYWLLRKK